jgi:hydroxypyruvate isomerase
MIDRRTLLAASAVAALPPGLASAQPKKGRLKQGVTRQVFGKGASIEDCCRQARAMGVTGFDFIDNPKDWPLLKRYGMTVSMLQADYGGGSSEIWPPNGPLGWHAVGLKEAQGDYLKAMHDLIDAAAREGFPNVIVLAGSKDKVTYQQGADNAVEFLGKLKAHAEQRKVTVCMELFNRLGVEATRNALFDHAAWGVDVCKRVASPRVKILYDIFHAQLTEGDIVQTLKANIAWIGHVHTGSVPGRHELFRDNELDYRFIAQTLADLKYGGFVSHEWTPSPGSNVADDFRRTVELMTV